MRSHFQILTVGATVLSIESDYGTSDRNLNNNESNASLSRYSGVSGKKAKQLPINSNGVYAYEQV